MKNKIENKEQTEKRRGFMTFTGSLSLAALLSTFTSKAAKTMIKKAPDLNRRKISVIIHPSAVKRNRKG